MELIHHDQSIIIVISIDQSMISRVQMNRHAYIEMERSIKGTLTKINKHHNSRSTVTNGSIHDWNRANNGRVI